VDDLFFLSLSLLLLLFWLTFLLPLLLPLLGLPFETFRDVVGCRGSPFFSPARFFLFDGGGDDDDDEDDAFTDDDDDNNLILILVLLMVVSCFSFFVFLGYINWRLRSIEKMIIRSLSLQEKNGPFPLSVSYSGLVYLYLLLSSRPGDTRLEQLADCEQRACSVWFGLVLFSVRAITNILGSVVSRMLTLID